MSPRRRRLSTHAASATASPTCAASRSSKVPADEVLAACARGGGRSVPAGGADERAQPLRARKRKTRGGFGLLCSSRRCTGGRARPAPASTPASGAPRNLLSAAGEPEPGRAPAAHVAGAARRPRPHLRRRPPPQRGLALLLGRPGRLERHRGSGADRAAAAARRTTRATSTSPGRARWAWRVVPPLEAAPRVATSGPGDDRDGGARRHRGLDVVASPGEPIRAIADGTVIFAGVNLRGNARYGPIARQAHRPLARKQTWARAASTCASATVSASPGEAASAWSPATCTSTATSWPPASR